MQGFSRFVSVLASCAATFAMVSVLACKDNGAAAPAPAGDGSPAVSDTPPAASNGASVTCTPETRNVELCTLENFPVCATLSDDSTKSFANKCTACNDEAVLSYVEGECAATPPA